MISAEENIEAIESETEIKDIDFDEAVNAQEDNINYFQEDDVVYNIEKDFYVGSQGELRLKAEGLFKKAREKGISIEEIDVITLKEKKEEIPGLGEVELPTFIAKVKGRLIKTGQYITDGKQIDYYNRYQKYIAKKLYQKNLIRSEKGKILYEGGKPKVKSEPVLSLTEWEKFEIGKEMIEDKEFGLEKTITGACDRVIRKLMGENDWLYPGEAKLLDEEFEEVQKRIKSSRMTNKPEDKIEGAEKKATEKQKNFFKSRINNSGLDAEDKKVMDVIMEELGYGNNIDDLTVNQMSKAINNIYNIVPIVKDKLNKQVQ